MADAFVIHDKEHMVEAVKDLTRFMATYGDQNGYENYSARTFVNDVLYGLGVALDNEKYQYAQGYRKFEEDLKGFLNEKDGVS